MCGPELDGGGRRDSGGGVRGKRERTLGTKVCDLSSEVGPCHDEMGEELGTIWGEEGPN